MQHSLTYLCALSMIIASSTVAMEKKHYQEELFGKVEEAAYNKLQRRASKQKKRYSSKEEIKVTDKQAALLYTQRHTAKK